MYVAMNDLSMLWLGIDIIRRRLDLIYEEIVGQMGLTTVEWFLLRALYKQDGQLAGALARAVGRPPTSFTPTLDKLVEKGLVERRPDKKDRRVVHIHLTPEGDRLRERAERAARVLDQLFESNIDEEIIDSLRALLAHVQQMKPLGV